MDKPITINIHIHITPSGVSVGSEDLTEASESEETNTPIASHNVGFQIAQDNWVYDD